MGTGAGAAGTEELQVHLLDGANGAKGMADPSEASSRRRGRARCTRLCGCLRWAKHELLGFGVLFLVGLILGVALPKDAKLRDPAVATISNVLGWQYFCAWTISFYPQIVINHRRRTTVGLSLDFELLNLLGFLAYTAFASAFYGSAHIQGAYRERHDGNESKVAVQDLFFAGHAVGITIVTILQMFYWDGFLPTVRTRLSKPVSLLLGLLVFGALLGAILAATVSGNEPDAWLSFLYFLSYEKLFISTIKGFPQAHLNYTRKSTEGWSIYNILCDFTGGALSVSQLILDCWATDDWSGIRGDPLKFGLGLVSMTFDVFFCIQHFILYPEKTRRGAEKRRGPEENEDILV